MQFSRLFNRSREAVLKHSVNTEIAALNQSQRSKKRTTAVVSAVLVSSMAAMPALAGTGGDALFKDTFDSSLGVIQGYGAKLATGVSGAFAMIGSILKFQPQLIAGTLGVGFTGAGVDNAIDFTVTGLLM